MISVIAILWTKNIRENSSNSWAVVPVCPGYETINASRGKTIDCSIKLLQFLYSKPIVTSQDVREELKISERTARDLIQEMTRIELLQEVTGYKRNRAYSFKSYLDLF